MKTIVIYDDTGRKNDVIADIIGEKGFADVVVKKKRIEEYYKEYLDALYPNLIWRKLHSAFEYAELLNEIELLDAENYRVIHCFSNFLIVDFAKASLAFKKLEFIDEAYGMLHNKRIVAAMFPSLPSYISFCKHVVSGQKAWDLAKNLPDSFEVEGMVDIGMIDNFVQCITGNFDSRYFNSLKGNEFTLIKSSSDKKKIKAEYTFYQLLPESMKYWFVMPFNYQEDAITASYTMERLHMPDLAIKWVHGSMDENEFSSLMDKYFYFFLSRSSQVCSQAEYQSMSDALYVDKVHSRIEALKQLPAFAPIKTFLASTDITSIDALAQRYFTLKHTIEKRLSYPFVKVVGHGDPGFANALYNKSTKTLKFIDPKGALTPDELWANPYYDVAKLSHSVCGRYDFFNNGLFEIKVNDRFNYELSIPADQTRFKQIFQDKVQENGFDFLSVRIYEASLFLSMLPLHIDNPFKVFGFILNVQHILNELEHSMQ